MNETVYINSNDAYATYGISFPPEAINAIRTFAGLKDFVKNESRDEHGSRIIAHNPRVSERELTIEMHLSASNEEQFEERRESLKTLLNTGLIVIGLRGETYQFIYQSCSQFAQVGNIAKFVLKLVEPNPTNR